MRSWRRGWLVACREMRDRSRSRAFWVSVALTVLAVAAMVALPALLVGGHTTSRVGLAGSVPRQLPAALITEARAAGFTVRTESYGSPAAGEQAVRDRQIDVLVVDGRHLSWPRIPDQKLRAVVVGAIRLDALRTRAAAAGISRQALSSVLAPVTVTDETLSSAPGRDTDDENVAMATSALLMLCIATFGGLVLSGVVEEKSSRVVEVLLTRVTPRELLAGKIAGIGLLGLGQIAVVALVALLAAGVAGSVEVPAVTVEVAVWAVVWFALGYAVYATAFGALGSLASRSEDAQTVAGPVTVFLVAGYFAAFAATGSPTAGWAQAVSLLPLTAPMAMPARIALGVAAWWEPFVAAVLALATIAGLVYFGGRVYVRAILHSGATLSLAEAWRSAPGRAAGGSPALPDGRAPSPTPARSPAAHRNAAQAVVVGGALSAGVAVAVVAGDVVFGVAVGAGLMAVGTRGLRARNGYTRGPSRRPRGGGRWRL